MLKGQAVLTAAHRYASRGIPVVPIESNGKAPVVKGGVHAASVDRKQIEDWWQRWPRSSLALACGEAAGFDVLDVDKQHGGLESLARYVDAHGPLPDTACQMTPSGGFHLLFRYQPGLKNWSGGQGTAPPGLDCRTNGGMVRTAPVEGYTWQPFLDPAELPPWPACLATYFQKIERPCMPFSSRPLVTPVHADRAARYVTAAISRLADEIAMARPGCQQPTLNGACYRAGRLLAAAPDLATSEIVPTLVNAGLAMQNQMGRKSWNRNEIECTVRRALDDGRREGPAALPDFSEPIHVGRGHCR